MEYRENKYKILFENIEIYDNFKRLSYYLGEPLWMYVYGWVKFQSYDKIKLFWKLKKNII